MLSRIGLTGSGCRECQRRFAVSFDTSHSTPSFARKQPESKDRSLRGTFRFFLPACFDSTRLVSVVWDIPAYFPPTVSNGAVIRRHNRKRKRPRHVVERFSRFLYQSLGLCSVISRHSSVRLACQGRNRSRNGSYALILEMSEVFVGQDSTCVPQKLYSLFLLVMTTSD